MAKKQEEKSLKFSVLISIYYKENPKFCDLALKSILIDQTVKPDEVLIVKDGELTDELEKVLQKYVDKFPKVIKFLAFKKNQGLGMALQKGLEKCKYNIVMRMDTDDVACKYRFEKQLNYMKQHPEVSVVGSAIGEFVDSPKEKLRMKNMPLSYEEVVSYSKFRNPLNHMTVCFRKNDILEVGNYKPLMYLEDHYLWSRLLVSGKKIENLPNVLVKVRIGNGFYERRGNKQYLSGWKFLQNYLYENKYITFMQKLRNKLGMLVIIYCPEWARKILYNKILRKGSV